MRKSVQLSRTLYVDDSFFQFLLNNPCSISNLFFNIELNKDINYIASTEFQDKASYLPKSKWVDSSHFDPYDKGIGRVQLKIGRLINKILPVDILEKYDITKQEIENFVNLYKSWFDPTKFVFKVVEGEEIRYWYNENNYYAPNDNQTGSLWNSCMRYQNRLKFLDLYCKNPNVKMLVMLREDNGTLKLRSRALLWEKVEVMKSFVDTLPDEIKIMDRIYYVFDSDVNTFKKWAFENGYIPKFEQNAKTHQFFDIKGQVVRIKCKVQLDKSKFGYYPYLDTFPYFNYSDGELCNDEYGSWDYKLVQATGGLEPERSEEEDEHQDDTW